MGSATLWGVSHLNPFLPSEYPLVEERGYWFSLVNPIFPMDLVERWQHSAVDNLEAGKLLYNDGRHRAAVSRFYYAAYQAATAICLRHGDEGQFPQGWNNPSHDQLPDLIRNNGDLTRSVRRTVSRLLRVLRHSREDADYRMGITVNAVTAQDCLYGVVTVLELLEVI